ncbi:MAG: hypothetical protein ACPGUC_07375 [Gammaproteobacteria bacterium]
MKNTHYPTALGGLGGLLLSPQTLAHGTHTQALGQLEHLLMHAWPAFLAAPLLLYLYRVMRIGLQRSAHDQTRSRRSHWLH